MANATDACAPILGNASLLCVDPLSDEAAACLQDAAGTGLFGSYLVFWRCTLHASPLSLLLLVPWLLMLLLALGSTADVFLMPQLHYLSDLLRLSPDVAGVTLLAVGNGAPDVFSAIAVATGNLQTQMDLSLMLSDIIGGTLFIMTVVVGSVVWLASDRSPGWTVGKLPFWRDTIALLVAVSAVLKVAHDGVINIEEAVGFLLLHAVYIGLVLTLPRLSRLLKARRARIGGAPTSSRTSAPTSALLSLAHPFASSSPLPFVEPLAGHSAPPFADLGPLGPLNGVTSNIGGGPLPPLTVTAPLTASEAARLPLSRATLAPEPSRHQLQPLSLEPAQTGRASNPSSSNRHGGSSESLRLQWLWGEWGTPGEAEARGEGSRGGAGAAAAHGGLFGGGGRVAMSGLDMPEGGSGVAAWAMWLLELPLSTLRWATIPSSDGEWDRRRRFWTAACPPLAICLFAAEVYSNLGGGGGGGDPCPNATAAAGGGGGGRGGLNSTRLTSISLLASSISQDSSISRDEVSSSLASQGARISLTSQGGGGGARGALDETLDEAVGGTTTSTAFESDLHRLLAATLGGSGVPLLACLVAAALPLALLLYCASHNQAPPRWQPLLVGAGFVMTVVWLDRIATELIALIETFGYLFGISTSILGLTVIAIGNSIGDFVADTAAAREGSVSAVRMALAACFGSPVIMNIVSVGLSFTLRLLLSGGAPICFSPINGVTRLGFLLFYLTVLSHLIVFPLNGYRYKSASKVSQ